MSSRVSNPLALFSRTLEGLFGRREPVPRHKAHSRKSLRFEGLEGRALLAATDLAAISGRVFRDTTGNGFNNGEQVVGATVNLYRDNGDGIFNSGTDTLIGPDTTDANGNYRFDTLTAANYFVQQPAQTVSNVVLLDTVSNLIQISATDVQGVAGVNIDTFNTTQQNVSATVGNPGESNLAAAEAIGGRRKMAVTATAGGLQLLANDSINGPQRLAFLSGPGAAGSSQVTWDGSLGAGNSLNPTGLGSADITSGGASTGINLTTGEDLAGGTVTLRLYTDAINFSTVTINVPVTGGGLATSNVYIPFTDFTNGGGVGATLTNIGAIQMDIDPGANAADGQIDAIGALGPTVKTQNFDNLQADLALSKIVSSSTPTKGQNVTFTVTVTNQGALNATGVAVLDQLPAGLTFVSSTPSQGTYSNNTGIWTVGAVNQGASATLQIVATVTTSGTKTNTAQVSAMDQVDIDSTPNNSNAQEDDQQSVSLTPQVADLSLTKGVNNSTPNVNQNVTFTLTLSNAGPSTATNVTVADTLPAGLTFVSSTPSQGSYVSNTGVWTVGTVNSGASATLSIIATVTTAGTKTNTAQVSAADQFDLDSTPNNSVPTEDDQASAAVTPQTIDLSLSKTVDNSTPARNANITYTLTLANGGPANATNVTATDVLPTGLTFVSSTPSQGSYNSTTGVWTVGSVNSGANATLAITATVTTSGLKTNTAQVTAADQFDPDSTPNNSVATEDDQASVVITPPRTLTKRLFLAR